jgi:hypothetical protein
LEAFVFFLALPKYKPEAISRFLKNRSDMELGKSENLKGEH